MRAPPRWCRQVTAAAAVAGIAVGLCATFPPLELLEPIQDASDETGRPPVGHPKHPLSAIPPLPVAEDITALASFLVTNVDDATEDAVKARIETEIRAEFDRIMAAGGKTPNEAAAEALEIIRARAKEGKV